MHGLRRQLHVPASGQHDGLFCQYRKVCRRSGQRTAEKVKFVQFPKLPGAAAAPVFDMGIKAKSEEKAKRKFERYSKRS